jgi:hypothetical protein
LHGGFLALLASLALLAAGSAAEAWLNGPARPARWAPARRYALLAGLCGLASRRNP